MLAAKDGNLDIRPPATTNVISTNNVVSYEAICENVAVKELPSTGFPRPSINGGRKVEANFLAETREGPRLIRRANP